MSVKHQPLPLEALGLQIQFGGRYVVPLAEIAEDWFGLNEKQAKFAAARQQLPVPAFKLREGERCNWHVTVADLAKLVADRRAQADSEWKKMRGAA